MPFLGLADALGYLLSQRRSFARQLGLGIRLHLVGIQRCDADDTHRHDEQSGKHLGDREAARTNEQKRHLRVNSRDDRYPDGQRKALPSASRCATRGRPVWLMMMARACNEPRESQKMIVPLTTPCVVGRNEYARRFEVIDPPDHPSERAIKSSPASRWGGSSRSRFANTIQPRVQSPARGSQLRPSVERHTLTICARLIASDRARNSECRNRLTTVARWLLR